MDRYYESSPPPKAKKTQTELLLSDILWLLVKVAFIITAVILLFTFMFGVYRNEDPSMNPAIKDGDLVVYYRLDKKYAASDVLAADVNGKTIALRVIAVAGDEVDIRDGELYINGSMQTESGIYSATDSYEEGVRFPLTVPRGSVFALGDNRYNSVDSRIFGPIPAEETKGKVMSLIRRRGI